MIKTNDEANNNFSIKSHKLIQLIKEQEACYNLFHYLRKIEDIQLKKICVVCIGTDRVTGDSLGPLVGTFLTTVYSNDQPKELDANNSIMEYQIEGNKFGTAHLFGTLEYPITAKNLEKAKNLIETLYPNAVVLAIDACLGEHASIGKVFVKKGPLIPGAGVNKKLVGIGDIAITGAVNVKGFMENLLLANTRLNTVLNLSKIISNVVVQNLEKISELRLQSSEKYPNSLEYGISRPSYSPDVYKDFCNSILNSNATTNKLR